MDQTDGGDKRVVGLYGEMRLAMELHQRGWQVYRAYIDETIDFTIMKSYCDVCKDFRDALRRVQTYKGRKRTTVTNLCERCESDSLRVIARFVQVKTSEGIRKPSKPEERTYSFHPKLRYHLADGRVFYVWIQVWDPDNVSYFIFKTEDVAKFDNLELDSYQITDNQKTNLRIDREGNVLNQGRLFPTAEVFAEFHNDFDILDELLAADGV